MDRFEQRALGDGGTGGLLLLLGVASILTLFGCAAPGSEAEPAWIALGTEERSERLLAASGTGPRVLRVGEAELQFVELGPALDARGVAGSGLPWLFVHGLGGSMGDFAPLLISAGRRHRVLAIDLPGFGGSVSAAGDYTIAAFVKALRRFLRATGTPRVHLVCHSMGGQVCLGTALDVPQAVASLVLIDSAGTYSREEFIERATRGALGRVHPDKDPGIQMLIGGEMEIVRRLLGNDPFIMSAIASFKENYRDRVRDVRVPTLIIWGADDPLFPVSYASHLRESIEGSSLRVVQDAGHSPQMSHPDQVLGWIVEFHDRVLLDAQDGGLR